MIELMAAMMGALAVFVAIGALTGQFGYSQRRIAARTVTLQRQGLGGGGPAATASLLLKEDSLAGTESVSRLLGRFTWAADRAKRLDQADVPLKVSEYILLLIAGFVATAFVIALISGLILVGLGFGVATFVLAEMWLKSRAARRVTMFNRQLPLALQVMSTSLRSGFGIMEAVATVAREMDNPIAYEFQRVLDEARVGGSFEDGLNTMVERAESEDLRIVARALEIHRKVGGDLAQILENVAGTMREREQLRGHIRALTAQQRFGGIIVGLLPLYVIGLFSVANPEFISPLWEETAGRILFGVAVVLEIVGVFLMRRVMAIEV
ncbi:MAG: type II secretion system F family protein [Dehalococcoidia bacterium]